MRNSKNKTSENAQYLSFSVNGENYCVNVAQVNEIKNYAISSKLPKALPFMNGILNVRGQIVPIFDLKSRFGFGATDVNSSSVIVIISLHGENIGILVDAVSDIINIANDEVATSDTVRISIDGKFVEGIAFKDEKPYILLDLQELFSKDTLQSLKEINCEHV